MGAPAAPKAPFPWGPIGTLWLINFSTTFANWSVMPFVPYLVYDLGLVADFREPGLYAGVIIASNRIGAMLTSYGFGKWSDKHGRRPVLQVMLVGLGLTTLLFGFSSSLEMAVVVRFIGGLASGGRDLTQVMATEICEHCPEHQARAMSTNAAVWGLAVIMGPAIGGLLARPATNYPGLVAADGFWATYPYLPPCLFGSALCLLSLMGIATWLPETVGLNRNLLPPSGDGSIRPDQTGSVAGEDKGYGESEMSGLLGGTAGEGSEMSGLLGGTAGEGSQVAVRKTVAAEAEAADASLREQRCFFCTSLVTRTIVTIKTVQAFYVVGDDNTFPLWTAAPRDAGGLQFSTSKTGAALAMMGATVVLAQLLVYPWVSTRLGARRSYILLTVVQVPFFMLQPFAAWFENEQAVWAFLLLSCIKNMCIEMSIVGAAILQNNAVSASERGALSGFASAVSGAGQTLAPLLTAPLFAWSLTNGYVWPLDVWLLFLVYAACAAVNSALGLRLPASIESH